jgi:hypothetical protein
LSVPPFCSGSVARRSRTCRARDRCGWPGPEATRERRAAKRHLLLHAQAWWDAQRFDQPAWHVVEWRDQKVRHIQLHVAKALGKVVAACGDEAAKASIPEAIARVRDEVVPDVAIYRSQLLHTFPDCGDPTALRWCPSARVAARSVIAPRHGHAPRAEQLFPAVLLLGRASAQLAAYLEPREHGVMSPPSYIWGAIQNLHACAEALATAFAVDLMHAHQARLEALLGAPLPTSLVEGSGDGR